MALVSMKRDPEKTEVMPGAPAGDMPMYSYGTKLCLGDDELKALGIALPTVGQKFAIVAIAECTNSRAEKVQEGEAEIGCDLQITDMEVTAAGGKDPAQSLWPDKE